MISPRWEVQTRGAAVSLRADGSVAFVTPDGEVVLLAKTGSAADSFPLKGPTGAGAPLGLWELPGASGWLVLRAGLSELIRITGQTGGVAREQSAFAKGGEPIVDVCVFGELVTVVRASSVEVWTLTGQRRWENREGPFVKATMVQKAVVALRQDGTTVFLSMMSGAETGSVKLEVPEPAHTWHLCSLPGQRFAMALGDWLVIVDVAKEKVFRRTRMRAKVSALAANERRAVAGLEDGWVHAIEVLTGEIRSTAQVHSGPVRALAVNADGACSIAEDVRGWELSALAGTTTLSTPVTSVFARGSLLAIGDRAGRLRVQKGVEEVASLRLEGAVTFTALDAEEGVIAVTSSLLVRLPKPWKTPKPLVLEAPCTAFCADAAYTFCGNREGTVDVYDGSGRITHYTLTEGPISALARARGAYLAVGTDALDGRIFIVDVAEAKVVHRVEAHQEAFGVTALACEPRGKILASGSDDGTVALIEIASGRVLARIKVGEAPVSMAFDAESKRLAAVLADGAVVVMWLAKKGAVSRLECPKATHVSWGEMLAVGLESGRIEFLTP